MSQDGATSRAKLPAVWAGCSGANGGSTRDKPGTRNEAGEMLWVVLMPLQPEQTSMRLAQTNIMLRSFQFDLTDIHYKSMTPAATFNSWSPKLSKVKNTRFCPPSLQAGPGRIQLTMRFASPALELHEQRQCNTGAPPRNRSRRHWRRIVWVCGLLLVTGVPVQLLAASDITNALALAQQTYQKAMAEFTQHPNDLDRAWQAGRACFELGEFAENKDERARLAEEGMQACRRAVAIQSNSAPAHYYLAMNLGQLMRSKGWGGIRYLSQLRGEFEAAAALAPKLDYAGPERNLGYLFRDTPGFFGGSKREAKKHLERAVQLAPDFPENRLALTEGLIDWGEKAAARQQLEALEALWPKARERFSGTQYAPAWADWEERLEKLKKKLK